MGDSVTRLEHDSVSVCRAHAALLESMFTPAWFDTTRQDRHPALQRMRLLREHITSDGALCPSLDDHDGLCLLAELLLDGFHVMTACGGRVGSLDAGELANYGDDKVRRRLAAVVSDPGQFLSVMTELSRAALHIGVGHSVRAVEEKRLADLVVRIPGVALPLIVDCKHVSKDTSINRFRKLINDANSQIKAHGVQCHGAVVIDVTDRDRVFIQHTRSRPTRRLFTPPGILEARAAAQDAMFWHNSAVGVAVLVWNEIRLRPEGRSWRLMISKRTLQVYHRHPRIQPPEEVVLALEKEAGGVSLRISPPS